jgi:hypothetical protein
VRGSSEKVFEWRSRSKQHLPGLSFCHYVFLRQIQPFNHFFVPSFNQSKTPIILYPSTTHPIGPSRPTGMVYFQNPWFVADMRSIVFACTCNFMQLRKLRFPCGKCSVESRNSMKFSSQIFLAGPSRCRNTFLEVVPSSSWFPQRRSQSCEAVDRFADVPGISRWIWMDLWI